MVNDVIWVQATACLSILGCMIILVLYHGNTKIQKKKINALVSTIAACDLFAALGVCIGEPHDGTPSCWIQSMATSYFPLVSVFLTTLIAYVLYQLVCHNKRITDFPRVVYYMCWGIPFILVLLPLSTNRYGNPGSDRGWCFLDHRSNMPKWTLVFWIIVAFYLWFYLAVLTYLVLLWFIAYRVLHVYGTHARASQELEKKRLRSRILQSLMRLVWYPLIVIICWLPSALHDVSEALSRHANYLHISITVLNMFPAAQGLLTSIAFICTNQDAQGILFGLKEPLLSPSPTADLNHLRGSTLSPAFGTSTVDTAHFDHDKTGAIGNSSTDAHKSASSNSATKGDPLWSCRLAYFSEDTDGYSSDEGF